MADTVGENSEGAYDEIEIEDMEYDEEKKLWTYPCPCGDKFVITEVSPPPNYLLLFGIPTNFCSLKKDDLLNGEEIARCPSCSLFIRVIYEVEEEDDDSHDLAHVPKAVVAY